MARMRSLAALLVFAAGACQAKRTLHDSGIGGGVDAARDAAVASVPKFLDVSGNSFLAEAADNFVPKDFHDKVQAAMKNFQAGDKTINPQIKDYAKLVAGAMMLDSSGDSNIANQRLGDVIRQLVKFTFNLAKVYLTAPEKIVTELPKDLAEAIGHSQPQNFAAYFADHEQIYKDLLGIVYKEDGETGSLTHPDSIDIGGQFINYAPCIVSITPTGLNFGAEGINIAPSIFQSTPVGVIINPQAVQLQPALLYTSPTGLNVQPQGLNIAPTLIAVTPGSFSYTSTGGNVAPSLISVSVEQPDDDDSGGGDSPSPAPSPSES